MSLAASCVVVVTQLKLIACTAIILLFRELIVHDGPNRWTKVTLRRLDPASKDPGAPIYLPDEVIERPFVGFGLMFEADAVARSLKS